MQHLLQYVLIPLLFVGVMLVGTIWLWEERADLLAQSDKEVLPVPALRPLSLGAWERLYGGGHGIDTIITLDDASLRVSTAADGGWYGAQASLPTEVDWNQEILRFSVRVQDWQELERLFLLFSDSAGDTGYVGLNLTNHFAQPPNQEWLTIVVDTSAFTPIEGDFQWTQADTLAVRVVPQEGVSTRVWFDNFALIPKTERLAPVTFTFDDGFASVMEAESVLTEYGYAATAYVIPEFIGTEDYLSQNEVDFLALQGWDVAGHGADNLTSLTPQEVDTHLASMYHYLHERGYAGKSHFAYPNGGYTPDVQSQVMEYFSSARTIDGFIQPKEYWYPTTVSAVTISSSTPVTEILNTINQAQKEGNWLILVWHDLVKTYPRRDVEYRHEDFALIVDYLYERNIPVAPYSQAYEELSSGVLQ